MNGSVARIDADGLAVAVEHAFGNCPQYIQLRDFEIVEPAANGARVETATRLSDADRAVITAADTFFVASYADLEDGRRQVDVSHRGGKAGFVRGVLTIPDFAGNLHFNTLGNIVLNGRAGLIFPDFETGEVLQVTGEAQVDFDSAEIAAFQGAERLWRFRPRRIVRRADATAVRWRLRAKPWSPNSLMTGDWTEAAERLAAQELREAWRPFRIAGVKDESRTIRSFILEPTDGAGLIPHEAGQHLPIRLSLPQAEKPVIRTYTLSSAPSDGWFRISVKRDGLVSQHLHDQVQTGDVIEARAPAGAFAIDATERRPAVLLAAGVGVTPILAMLRHIVYEGLRTRRVRPTTLFYAARSVEDRAFDREIDALVELAGGAVRLVRVLSAPPEGEAPGALYEIAGHIDMDLMRAALSFGDYDFYMCGPGGFMQSVYDGLRGLNVSDRRIHAEAFGPSALIRTPDSGSPAKPANTPADKPVAVAFARSGKEARWTREAGALLDLAEARGMSPAFSCRTGACGTCKVKIAKGAVAYETPPSAEVADDEALICSAVPAAEGGDVLILPMAFETQPPCVRSSDIPASGEARPSITSK